MRRIISLIMAIAMIVTMCSFAISASAEDTVNYNRVYVKKPANWDTVRIWAWGSNGDAFKGGWNNRPTLVQLAPDSDIYYFEDKDNVLHEGDSFILNSKSGSLTTGNQTNCLQLNKLYILEPNVNKPVVCDYTDEDFELGGVIYDEPISTTFGTSENLLPEGGYTFKTDGVGGLTLLLKVEGLKGQSVSLGSAKIAFYHDEVPAQDAWNSEETSAEARTINNLNSTYWQRSGFQREFTSDGVYALYVPFASLHQSWKYYDANKFSSKGGLTKLEEFAPFAGAAYKGSSGTLTETTDETVSLSLIGIIEGDVHTHTVFAKNAEGKDLAMGITTLSVDAKPTNGNTRSVWTQLDTGFSLFGDMIGSDGSVYVSSYATKDGRAIDYIIGESSVYPQYSAALPVVISAENTTENTKDYTVDISVDAADVNSMNLALTYDKKVFTNPRLDDGTALEETADGALLSAAADSAKVIFDLAYFVPTGDYSISASGTANNGADIPAKSKNTIIHIDSMHQEGYFFSDAKSVVINSAPEGTAPKAQTLWSGDVSLGGAKDGATYVFKVEGVETPIVADKFNYHADLGGWDQWTLNCGQSQNKSATYLTLDKDGCYYMYVNQDNMDANKLYAIKDFNIFGTTGNKLRDAVNTNENARFTMLAIVADNLAPEVTYYMDDESLIGAYTKSYTDHTGRIQYMSGDAGKGELVSVSDIYTENTGLVSPTKASDDKYSYNFIGWFDDNGNDVSDMPVYEVMSVHARFEPVEMKDPELSFETLSFTVGNTMSFNVNVRFAPNSDLYDTDTFTLDVDMKDENSEWAVLGNKSVTGTKDEQGVYNINFKVDGIPMAYLANSLKVHFSTDGAQIPLELEEDSMMNSSGEYVDLSFVNYSAYLRETSADTALSALLDTMLNYTAAVQVYKNYKADALANDGIANNIKSIADYTADDWRAYSAMSRKVSSSLDKQVVFTGSKLLMSSDKTGFRFVFKVADDVDVNTLTLKVMCDGALVSEVPGSEFTYNGAKYSADFDGYAPDEFDTQLTIIVCNAEGEQVSNTAYDSIPAVAKAVSADERYESLRPILSGMLAYSGAVKEYIGK